MRQRSVIRQPVGLIVIDTYAKGIAAGGGDEDKAQHANIVAANLKMIHERLKIPSTSRRSVIQCKEKAAGSVE